MLDSNRAGRLSYIGSLTAVVLGLYLSSRYSYLLFHSLIELITIAVAFTFFMLTWNTRRYLTNSCLRLIGIGYPFIALIDLLHTLSYKGMGLFPGYGPNLPTQLWIAARYLQAVTLFAAPLLLERRLNHRAIFGGYAAVVAVLVAMVFSGHFPDCFIEGKGLTSFKIGSEYGITALLLGALYLFFAKRQFFNDRVFVLTAASIVCTAFSEISFTAYVSVYGFANMAGHFFKLAAFYLIYRAILVTGLREPFELIFRELKQAEEALRKSQDSLEEKVRERTVELRAGEARYRSLIRNVRTAIVLHDGQGRLLDTNPLARELLGLSADQLLGKSLIDPEWHFLREDGSVMPVAEYPVRLVLSTRRPLRGYVMGISRLDRTEVSWALVNAEPEYDDAGEIARVIVSFVDISERKRAEIRLNEQLLFLQQLIDSIPIPVYYKSPEGLYLGCNAAFEVFTGLARKDIVGKTVHEVVPKERADKHHEADLALLCHTGMQTYEVSGIFKDGKHHDVIFNKATFVDANDCVAGTVGALMDITERKAAEEALRQLNTELDMRVLDRTAELKAANKELDAFAYSVSHDLRAPLRHIDGFLELLQKKVGKTLDEQSRHYMDVISDAAQKMGMLIDDLLSFSRMGRQAMSFQPVALESLVRGIIREHAPDAAGRTIAWRIGELPVVGGDAAMLRLVLANLISNSLKFTRLRQRAQIEIGSLPGPASETVIFVRDNGAGFDMTYVDKLFGVFQRLHRADEFEGTGIGLANVRRIIARHGGRTWAEGQVNQGATFFFSLPKPLQEA
ncbi:MAG: MASE3 domain-containing protein [Pseudomonadota bacterium]